MFDDCNYLGRQKTKMKEIVKKRKEKRKILQYTASNNYQGKIDGYGIFIAPGLSGICCVLICSLNSMLVCVCVEMYSIGSLKILVFLRLQYALSMGVSDSFDGRKRLKESIWSM